MDQGLVEITFQLKNFTSVDGCIPAVIGNLVQLGEWRPERALKADKSSVYTNYSDNETESRRQEYVWMCKAYIPAVTDYDWIWIVLSKNGNFMAMEDNGYRSRRYNSLYFDKVCSHAWEDKLHTSIKMSKITLKTHYMIANSNHHIAVLGSHPSMGCWVAEKSILAVEESKNSGSWQVPQNVLILWKWIVLDSVSNYVVRWEERKNRLLFVHTDHITAYAAWNSPDEAKITNSFNIPQFKKSFKKKNRNERKLNIGNSQKSPEKYSIVSELYENIIDSKLRYEFRIATPKLNKSWAHGKQCPLDMVTEAGSGSHGKRLLNVTTRSFSEETVSTYAIKEDDDGKISIHLDTDKKSYLSQESDSISSCMGISYGEQTLLKSEADGLLQEYNVRRKIEDDKSHYNQAKDSMLVKSLYDPKDSLLFRLCLKKTVTKLPRAANGYFYELHPIPLSKAFTTGPDKIVKEMKKKKIISNAEFNKENDCWRFTFYDIHNKDQRIFRESSADVPFAYGGVEGQSKTWVIVNLKETDVDTGNDEEFNLHGRLKDIWYDYMCRRGGFPLVI